MRKAGFVLALLFAGLAQAFAAPAPQPTLDDVRSLMVGTWQNADDTRFSRELDAGGRSTDRYDGDPSATSHGMWSVFTGAAAPAALAGYKFTPNGFYLVLQQQNGDVLLFQLTAASLASMEMVYLARGDTQRFVRLK